MNSSRENLLRGTQFNDNSTLRGPKTIDVGPPPPRYNGGKRYFLANALVQAILQKGMVVEIFKTFIHQSKIATSTTEYLLCASMWRR